MVGVEEMESTSNDSDRWRNHSVMAAPQFGFFRLPAVENEPLVRPCPAPAPTHEHDKQQMLTPVPFFPRFFFPFSAPQAQLCPRLCGARRHQGGRRRGKGLHPDRAHRHQRQGGACLCCCVCARCHQSGVQRLWPQRERSAQLASSRALRVV
jgi:hypothetical protein